MSSPTVRCGCCGSREAGPRPATAWTVEQQRSVDLPGLDGVWAGAGVEQVDIVVAAGEHQHPGPAVLA